MSEDRTSTSAYTTVAADSARVGLKRSYSCIEDRGTATRFVLTGAMGRAPHSNFDEFRASTDQGAASSTIATMPHLSSPSIFGEQSAVSSTKVPREEMEVDSGGASKRRESTNACTNCQRKKVKCSGLPVCTHCQSSNSECVFPVVRRRPATQKTGRPRGSSFRETGRKTAEGKAGRRESMLLDTLSQMEERIRFLESHNQKQIQMQAPPSPPTMEDKSRPPTAVDDGDNHLFSIPEDSPDVPQDKIVKARTSLLQFISAVDQSCNTDLVFDDTSSETSTQVGLRNLPRHGGKRMQSLLQQTKALDQSKVANHIDMFFNELHYLYPTVNENQFRARHAAFMASGIDGSSTSSTSGILMSVVESQQFAAQLNLLYAIIEILLADCSNLSSIPGWQEFCRADDIVYCLSWLGNGDLMTVHCLILKSIYLLYAEKPDGAYESIGRAMRLSFQIGLHTQRAYIKCTDFEKAMRQRTFWTLFYLDRDIAFSSGTPFGIHESEYDIEVSPAYNDKDLIVGGPLPVETPESSAACYPICNAKWSKLFPEVWTRMFAVNAKERESLEFIASTDARILFSATTFPKHLQWSTPESSMGSEASLPSFVQRQRLYLSLRTNHIRLLIRQELVLSPQLSDSQAEECLQLATSTIDKACAHAVSPSFLPLDRWHLTHYTVGALMSLVCLIIKQDSASMVRERAIEGFTNGLSLITQLSSTTIAARRALQRLNRIIGKVQQVISQLRGGGKPWDGIDLASFDLMESDSLQPFLDMSTTDIDNNDISQLLHNLDDQGLFGGSGFYADNFNSMQTPGTNNAFFDSSLGTTLPMAFSSI